MFTPPPLLKRLILLPLLIIALAIVLPPLFIDPAPQSIISPARHPAIKTHRVRLSNNIASHLYDADPFVKVQADALKKTLYSPEALLHTASSAYLLPEGTVITNDHKLLYLGDEAKETLSAKQKNYLRSWWLPKHDTITQTVANLACDEGTLYENWLFDVLPKIDILRASGQHYDRIFIPQLKYTFQKDSLSLLGIPEECLIETLPGSHLLCSQILIPELPEPAFRVSNANINSQTPTLKEKTPSAIATIRPSTVAFLRENFPPRKHPAPTPKKLFICAKNEATLFLVNEEELTEKLLEIGFVKVYQEDLSFNEQIRLFSQAQEIISLKRSLLANLVFAQPNTQVMELVGKDDSTPDHRYIASFLGIEHQTIYCQHNANTASGWLPQRGRYAKTGLIAPVEEIMTLLHNL